MTRIIAIVVILAAAGVGAWYFLLRGESFDLEAEMRGYLDSVTETELVPGAVVTAGSFAPASRNLEMRIAILQDADAEAAVAALREGATERYCSNPVTFQALAAGALFRHDIVTFDGEAIESFDTTGTELCAEAGIAPAAEG